MCRAWKWPRARIGPQGSCVVARGLETQVAGHTRAFRCAGESGESRRESEREGGEGGEKRGGQGRRKQGVVAADDGVYIGGMGQSWKGGGRRRRRGMNSSAVSTWCTGSRGIDEGLFHLHKRNGAALVAMDSG